MDLVLTKHVSFPIEGEPAEDEWLRTAYIDKREAVYIPAALIDNDEELILDFVEVDGVAFKNDGHLYIQADWACSVFPHHVVFLERIQNSVRRIHTMRKTQEARKIKAEYNIQ